jgi:hypothetical protein
VLFTMAGGATVLGGRYWGCWCGGWRVPRRRGWALGSLLAAGHAAALPNVVAGLMVPLRWRGHAVPVAGHPVSLSSAAGRRDVGGSQLVGGFGRVTAPLWGGWLFQHVGVNSPFHLAALLAGVALLLASRIPYPAKAGAAAERAASRAPPDTALAEGAPSAAAD